MSSKSDKSVKLDARGGEKGGSVWDDGVHDTVKKIYVGQGGSGVQYIKFEYENGGQITATEHGKKTFIEPEVFELKPGDYLVRVEGYYDTVYGSDDAFIQSVKFETKKGEKSQPFGLEGGKEFQLDNNGRKIIGFHGRAGDRLYSLGVHSESPVPAAKLEASGGKAGDLWDDGVYDTVKKIYVGQGGTGIQYVKFEYDNGGQTVAKEHGKRPFIEPEEFELQYPDEYLVGVEGYTDKVFGNDDAIIQSIKFVTNKGKVSPPFGLEGGETFKLENGGNKIIGFHGRVGEMLSSIGVYTVKAATPIAPATQKLDAQGGHAGTQWDEGAFDNVTKIFVGQGAAGIQYLKFEYEKNGVRVSGQDHGEKITADELGLDNPNEYLVSVEGTYDTAPGYNTPVLQSITLNTNKTSRSYGFDVGTKFSFKEEGSKIVGFHGNASKVIEGLGVYVKPIDK